MANKPIFDKILIANRGEIACRVIKTCRRLGIKTVAVHSTADEQAKHVRMADEKICIGPPQNSESYLRIDKVIDACLKAKVNAVHPGYGFLSENAEFSAELKKNNIIFIGPDAHSIEAMGDKIHSKKLAKEAGVTTIPGFIGEILSHKQLLEVANEIGYPVMVKASGGGGGKGMRVARNDKECVEFFDMCKEEAKSAFNNDKMLVEKFIENPRHIEMQVICDRRGNALWLNERECSIQRRNQKVIEEAPSTLLDAKTRKAMGEQAVAMCRKVQYVTAGTVENVVNPKKEFFFLEMNTRLQVEHPITELITGIDIVEQMIRASAGLELSVKQEDVHINGHATEARVYAEDPIKNYFPSIGRLTGYQEPSGEGIRVDSGIVEGSQISVYYDPLIAKLAAWGPTRDESLDRLGKALDEYVIRGLRHNVCLLRDVIDEPRYRSGNITTNYLPETYPNGFKKADINANQKEYLLAVSSIVHALRNRNLFGDKTAKICTTLVASLGHTRTDATELLISEVSDNVFEVRNAAGTAVRTILLNWKTEFPVVRSIENGVETVLQFWGTNEVTYNMQFRGTTFEVNVLTPQQHALSDFVPEPVSAVNVKQLLSPMPGVIVHITVEEGQVITAGTELLTLEAMKMRNKLRSEVDGKIKSIKCKMGKTVDDGELLIEFE